MFDIFSLDSIETGQTAVIDSLNNTGSIHRRLLDLGFIKGTRIKCLQKNSSGDTIAYFIRGTVIALRKDDAINILIHKM